MATARPMPRLAPVTRATFPERADKSGPFEVGNKNVGSDDARSREVHVNFHANAEQVEVRLASFGSQAVTRSDRIAAQELGHREHSLAGWLKLLNGQLTRTGGDD